MDTGADIVTFAVKNNIASLRSIFLNGATRCANGLVAAEEDVGAWGTERGFQVVDNAAATTHAGGGDDDTGSSFAFQIIDGVEMIPMTVDGGQLFESERLAAAFELAACFGIPVGLQLPIERCEAAGEG